MSKASKHSNSIVQGKQILILLLFIEIFHLAATLDLGKLLFFLNYIRYYFYLSIHNDLFQYFYIFSCCVTFCSYFIYLKLNFIFIFNVKQSTTNKKI